MLFRAVVVFTGGTEVGNGLLVVFATGPVGKLEFANDDEAPVGRMVTIVELVGTGIPGTVMLATVVAFADGGVGMIPLPVVTVDRATGDEVALPGKALATPALDGNVTLTEPLVGTGYTTVVEVIGTTMLMLEETVALVGREMVRVVEFNGTMTPRVEEIVTLVGTGKATVVEFNGTTMLKVEETVALVGRGKATVVVLRGRTILVDAGAGADALVGRGKTRVVEFRGRIILVDAGAVADALLKGVSGGGAADAVAMGLVGAPVSEGGKADAELLPVGTGGRTPVDSGSGSEVTLPVGNGAKSVVDPVVMTTLVAAAVPLTTMVVRLPVMAPADSIVLPGMDSEDALEVGSGTTSVEVLMGTMTLVAAAVPLMLTVERVAVIRPPEPVAVPGATVTLVNGTEEDGGGVTVYTGLTVVTEGTNVLFKEGGVTVTMERGPPVTPGTKTVSMLVVVTVETVTVDVPMTAANGV